MEVFRAWTFPIHDTYACARVRGGVCARASTYLTLVSAIVRENAVWLLSVFFVRKTRPVARGPSDLQ